MLALALLAAAAVTPPSDDEIVVIARKLHMIKVDMKAPKRGGKLVLERCGIRNGSGYAAVDNVPCEAAQQCMAASPVDRRALESCVEQRSQTRLDAIFEAWRAVHP